MFDHYFHRIYSIGKRWETLILSALFFSIPLVPRITTLVILLYAVVSLCTFDKRRLRNFLNRPEMILYTFLFVLLIIGLIYTVDVRTGIFKIQTQASFLVFPLLLGGKDLTPKERTTYLNSFVLGLLVAVLTCFFYAMYRGFSTGSYYILDEFSRKHHLMYYTEFSEILNLHPTYLSLYLGFALFYLISVPKNMLGYNLPVRVVLCIIFFGTLFLSSSKAGILSFVLITFLYLFYLLIKKRSIRYLYLLFALFVAICTMLVVNPTLYDRFSNISSSFDRVFFQKEQIYESTGIRLNLWELSFEAIKDAPILGHGTGSTFSVLNDKCIHFFSFSNCELLRHKNSHNDFLNFMVSNGLIFSMVFISAVVMTFLKAFRKKDILLIFFMFFMFLNMLFESLLQRERGIIFFMLFLVMLTVSRTQSKSTYE